MISGMPALTMDLGAITGTVPQQGRELADAGLSFGILEVLALIYAIGAVVVFGRLIYQAVFIHALTRLSGKTHHKGYTLVNMRSDTTPFSYFRRIFIPVEQLDSHSLNDIIAHEQSHLQQGHFIDLFLIEVMTVLQWFNPVIWLFEKSIKETHEYLADEAVVRSGNNKGRYQALMVNQAMGGPVFILTNQFNQSLLKKRMHMMRKMKTPQVAKLKFLLVLPLIAGLMLAFTGSGPNGNGTKQTEITITGQLSDKVTHSILPGAVVLIKGTTNGTVTDKQGHFTIHAGDNAILVFSIVGYKTQEVAVEKNQVINVLMDQDAHVVDLDVNLDVNAQQSQDENQHVGKEAASNETYVVTEEVPQYEGGPKAILDFLAANLKYPESAKKAGIEGKVYVNFVVDAQGKVTLAKIMRSASPSLNDEALRLVNLMKNWKPARQNGEPRSAAVTLPIEFRIK
jgi:TonB family protein